MKLTPAEIEGVARLARLDISKKEKKLYAEQLSVVFDYIGMLDEVDTDGVPETCQVTGLEDITRDDAAYSCDPEVRGAIIKAFPQKEAEYLKVKAVFE